MVDATMIEDGCKLIALSLNRCDIPTADKERLAQELATSYLKKCALPSSGIDLRYFGTGKACDASDDFLQMRYAFDQLVIRLIREDEKFSEIFKMTVNNEV